MVSNLPAPFVAGTVLPASKLNQILTAIGTWVTAQPLIAGLPLNATSSISRHRQQGDWVEVEFMAVASGAGTGTILLTPPVTPLADLGSQAVGVATLQQGATRRYATIRFSGSTLAFSTESATPSEQNAAAAVPFTWAVGNTISGRYAYRAA